MLKGKRILVVEDEPIVAMMVEDFLRELGALAVGPASNVSEAMSLVATSRLDAAILDVNLGEERSYGVADKLRERRVPFVFATGYGMAALESFDGIEVVRKPFGREQIAAALLNAIGGGRNDDS